MTVSPQSKFEEYSTLSMWRGVASLAVLFYHTAFTLFASAPAGYGLFYAACRQGYLGVQLFFVISGYCIANSACAIIRRNQGLRTFLRARFRRIYPPCWASLIGIALLSLIARFLAVRGILRASNLAAADMFHKPVLYYLANFSMGQYILRQPFMSNVCWSLCYEVAFYGIIGLFLVANRRWITEHVLLSGSHVITLGSLAVLTVIPNLRHYPWDLWPQFGLGIVTYDFLRHPDTYRSKIWGIAIILATSAFVVLRSFPIGPLHQPSRLTFAVSLAFAILLVVLYAYDNWLSGRFAVRALSTVGLFSYSLYLTHFSALGLVRQALNVVHHRHLSPMLPLVLSLAISVAIGAIFYHFFERPFVNTKHKAPTVLPPSAEHFIKGEKDLSNVTSRT